MKRGLCRSSAIEGLVRPSSELCCDKGEGIRLRDGKVDPVGLSPEEGGRGGEQADMGELESVDGRRQKGFNPLNGLGSRCGANGNAPIPPRPGNSKGFGGGFIPAKKR